jgi:hypothetical protein
MSRSEALEAVAEAAGMLSGNAQARGDNCALVRDDDLERLRAALSTLDAIPAPMPAMAAAPTGRDLRAIYDTALIARSHKGDPDVTRMSDCAEAAMRALWDAGAAHQLAAVVARLRERAAEHRRAHESAAAQGRVWTAEGQLEEGR